MKKILVLNGPNLNLTGLREPGIYGNDTYESICAELKAFAEGEGLFLETFQSNHEGELIDRIHGAMGTFDGLIINAGAYSHYSYAIRDAISAVKLPCVEVHLSNIAARDAFRHTSVLSPVCSGVIFGFGKRGYSLAVRALKEILV